MAKFKLEARTVIKSASLDLTAAQLEDLAAAAPRLQTVREYYESNGAGEAAEALEPVQQLLDSVASLVDQTGTIKPKRQIKRRTKANPTTGG